MRIAAFAIGLLATSPALAQTSQLKKATAAYEEFSKGDSEALEAAQVAIERAAAHKKTAELPETWTLRAQIGTAKALEQGIPSPETVDDVVGLWEGALERGVGLDDAKEDLARLVSSTNLILRDDLESKRIDEAWSRVGAAMRARKLLKDGGWSDERIEPPLLQLAILTAVRADGLEDAKTWFAEWHAMDRFEPSVAVQVANALAAMDPDGAVAFLEPLLEERPLNRAMLTAQIDILLAAEKTEDALARVQRAAEGEDAGSSTSQLLLGALYRKVGDDAAARAAYESAIEQNPQAAEAWLPLADLLIAEAKALKERIDSRELRRSQRNEAEDQRTANLESAATLLGHANAASPEPDKAILTQLVEVYTQLGRNEERDEAQKALDKAE